MDKKRHTLNLPPFPTFSVDKPSKSPRIFHNNAAAAAAGGGVGLAIVAAMNHITAQNNINSPQESAYKCTNLAVSPRSNPIPIISSAAKAAAHFRGGLNFESGSGNEGGVVDESDDESYTCVISYVGNHVIKKQFHYGDGAGVAFCGGDDSIKNISEVKPGLFFASTSPMILTINDDGDGWEGRRGFWTQDFLTSCYLCNKLLHGLDIFMYRGEKAFCSAECRDKQIMSDKYKEKCGCEARKGRDYSKSPCSSPQVVFAEVAAA